MEKKRELLKRYTAYKLDDVTVHISGRGFLFSYTIADAVCKDEFKGQYRYFGGLQCDYEVDSPEYKNIEKWLCEIAEKILNTKTPN